MIAPNEKAKLRLVDNGVKDKRDNLPVWAVSKELPDEVPEPKFSKEELLAMIAVLEEADATEPEREKIIEAVNKPKAAPRKKAKKLGNKGSSI